MQKNNFELMADRFLPKGICSGIFLGLFVLTATESRANDFPTVDRALFIEECMALKNHRNYETLYGCACTLDKIAEKYSYDEYVEADSYMRMRNMRGERGGLFRGSDQARKIRKQFTEIKTRAEAACFPKHVSSVAGGEEQKEK
jgi:hypothetical protein